MQASAACWKRTLQSYMTCPLPCIVGCCPCHASSAARVVGQLDNRDAGHPRTALGPEALVIAAVEAVTMLWPSRLSAHMAARAAKRPRQPRVR